MNILVRIKRAVLTGHYRFSAKALMEMDVDGLTQLDVAESVLNSVAIYKTLRSTSPRRSARRERLYVIDSFNFEGVPVYSKGVIRSIGAYESDFYILVSGKRSVASD